jgi:hypothetical protein
MMEGSEEDEMVMTAMSSDLAEPALRVVPLRQVLGEDEATEVSATQRAALERALPWVEFLGEVLRGAAPRIWADRAACRGQIDTMFPTDASTLAARQLCRACPVFEECARWAEGADAYGVVAGMSATTRRNQRHATA